MKSLGCGDVFFYAVGADAREVLWVAADFQRLRRTRGVETFDLAHAVTGLVVQVEMYPRSQHHIEHCSDLRVTEIGEPEATPEIWHAVGGTLVVERGKRGIKPKEPWLFHARIRLTDVVFRGPRGETQATAGPIILEGLVGW